MAAQSIVTAVRNDIDAFEMEDAPYIVLWVTQADDRYALLCAIARCLVSETDRVANAIQDAIALSTVIEPFNLIAMVREMRRRCPVRGAAKIRRFTQ